MLEFAILGFLIEGKSHGYDLKLKLSNLLGYHKPISDGSLYPALARMKKKNYIREVTTEEVTKKKAVEITVEGSDFFYRKLQEPTAVDITDRNRFYVYLNFLNLTDVESQILVLESRLLYIKSPKSFFTDGKKEIKSSELSDPFKKGMIHIAKETSKIEKRWLEETIASLRRY